MEPLLLAEQSPYRPALNDLAVELATASAGFARSLPAGTMRALAELVRGMTCYYYNRTLPAKAGQVLEAVLFRGELPHGDVPALLGTSERQARRVVSALLACRVLDSKSTRAPLVLAMPAALASRWLPGLFPESQD